MITQEQTKPQTWGRIKEREKYSQQKFNDMYVSKEVVRSPALLRASRRTGAVLVYLRFLAKRSMKQFEGGKSKRTEKGSYFIANQGEIQFTYQEAVELGLSETQFRNILDLLVEVGLIDVRQFIDVAKYVSLYGISERWKLYGMKDFVKKHREKRKGHSGFKKGNKFGRNAKK